MILKILNLLAGNVLRLTRIRYSKNLVSRISAGSLGLGWVSMLTAESVTKLFNMPSDSQPVPTLCLGEVAKFYSKPLLEQQWAERKHLQDLRFENSRNLPCR